MSSTRFTSSKFPWAAITVATRSCAPLIVRDITALVYPTWLLMSPWIIQILVCLSSGMSLRIAIVNDALSCLTAVCLLVCICRPFIRLHYVMKSSSIWLMMCVCVCALMLCFWVSGWFWGVIYMPMPRPRISAQSMQIGFADCGYWRHSDKVYCGLGSSAYR